MASLSQKNNLKREPLKLQSCASPYSLPGVICFLQHEWTKMEAERQAWELYKCEYEAKIKLLYGEVKSLRQLKCLLTRRIKMLEYALRRERLSKSTSIDEIDADSEFGNHEILGNLDAKVIESDAVGVIMQGKELMKQFLDEIGCVDSLIDVRNDRLKFNLQETFNDRFLKVNDFLRRMEPSKEQQTAQNEPTPSVGDTMSRDDCKIDLKNLSLKRQKDNSCEDAIDAFSFLNEAADTSPYEKGQNNNMWTGNVVISGNPPVMHNTSWPSRQYCEHPASALNQRIDLLAAPIEQQYENDTGAESGDNQINANTKSGHIVVGNREQSEYFLSAMKDNTSQSSVSTALLSDGMLMDYDELDPIVDRNDDGLPICDNIDQILNKQVCTSIWLEDAFTFSGHLDVVRTLSIHRNQPLLLTGSDDHTAKLWSMNPIHNGCRSYGNRCSPWHTIRKHTFPVKCVGFGPKSNWFYTADVQANVYLWSFYMSPSNTLISTDSCENLSVDIVTVLPTSSESIVCMLAIECVDILIASCTDRTFHTWLVDTCDTGGVAHSKPLSTQEAGIAIKLIETTTPNDILIAFDSAWFAKWSAVQNGIAYIPPSSDLNRFVPENCSMNDAFILPQVDANIVIGAFENGKILWFNLDVGQIIRAQLTHECAISNVIAVNSFLITFAIDGIARTWTNVVDTSEHAVCDIIQEKLLHRSKGDEAITSAVFHHPMLVTAGADGICKLLKILFTQDKEHCSSSSGGHIDVHSNNSQRVKSVSDTITQIDTPESNASRSISQL